LNNPEIQSDSIRTALVTGASRGIRAAIAEAPAASGARVAVNYQQNRAAAEQVYDSILNRFRQTFEMTMKLITS
jgi:NAD(P)-dependent dehydrogenase (short-subunit alcohol dehydrogenase family)